MLGAVTGKRWDELAAAVRRRRDLMKLRQSDLEARGGPSAGTVRNIEQASRESYSPRTFVQLEHALDWPDGVVDKILDGTATPSDVTEVVVRDPARERDFDPGSVRSFVDSAGVRHVGNLTRQERTEQLQRLGDEVYKPQIRRDEEDAIFELANQLIPMLARRSPSSPASRAAVTNLLDVMREVAEGMLPPEDTGADDS